MDLSALRERANTAAFTVSELNNYIKNLFEDNRTLASVTVKGEISNFTNHRSGHLYFSLKDADGQIRAVMFRSRVSALKFVPESGMKVIVYGSVTVYPRDGSYQIYVSSMQPDGIGALYLAYEQLKERLFNEGLFDSEHKKGLPSIPVSVGVITSPTGAAVRDIINVAGRRFPYARIYLYPSLVQGSGAEENLIKAVDYFDKSGLVDVVIIGRGGGSIEDLWAFNSEALARRIYSANVPIISAVGHETDFTICDFVSDLRAPTPSAAAELAVPDINELLMRLDGYCDRAAAALVRNTERARGRLERISDGVLSTGLLNFIDKKRTELNLLYADAENLVKNMMADFRTKLSVNAEKLTVMNPLSVLSRGYSVVENKNGVVGSVDDVFLDEVVTVILSDGRFDAKVTEAKKETVK